MRNTSRTRRSTGNTNASQNGRTARRSITPGGLDTNFHRALRSLECRAGACSAATQTRSPYSMVKTTSDNSSMAVNSAPYCVCSAGTESSVRDEVDDDQEDDQPADHEARSVSD